MTQGPWEVIDRELEGFDDIVILGPFDLRSKHRHGRAHVVEMRGYTGHYADTREDVLADARLIAAAPDMLALLRELVAVPPADIDAALLRAAVLVRRLVPPTRADADDHGHNSQLELHASERGEMGERE